jgi:hypothetical protein
MHSIDASRERIPSAGARPRTRVRCASIVRCALVLACCAGPWISAGAQSIQRFNIYRYVLDVDVPESAGFVALRAAPTTVLRGSAPKPFVATVMHRVGADQDRVTGAAIDFVPYYVLGGGIRGVSSYRSNSLRGRLLRVLTKTAFSIAVASDPQRSGSLLGAIALRTTFHDPHDPILNTRLPEQLDSALEVNGVSDVGLSDERLAGRGVDLRPLFTAARRAMRARGDVQVSAGWGLGGRLAGAALASDSLQDFRHTLWVTAQHARGHRFDLLLSAQLRDAFGDDRTVRPGIGVQRKSEPADLRLELSYDSEAERLHPGVSVNVHAGAGLLATAGLTTEPDETAGGSPSKARVTLSLQWYPTGER